MNNVAIVIPAMNEEASIGNVIRDVKSQLQCMIIVVDDASSDRTVDVARNAGAVVLPQVVNLGAWRATQTGLRYALKMGVEQVVTMDADSQHRAEDANRLLKKQREGYDLVVGSCISRGSIGRHLAWRFFRAITGLYVRDLTSGFRCYGRRSLEILVQPKATMLEYQDIGVLLLLSNNDLSYVEVDVSMNERTDGISRIFYSWNAVYRYLIYTFIYSTSKIYFPNKIGITKNVRLPWRRN